MHSFETKPLWRDVTPPSFAPLSKPGRADVVVIGGGMTGLTAACFFKRAGKSVCLLERDSIGSGETGHTTAHLTAMTDLRLGDLVKRFGRDGAALAWHAGLQAIEAIEQIVSSESIECHFRRVPAFLHASLEGKEDETKSLREEAELGRELGFDTTFVEQTPIVHRPGMRISNQAKFHPGEYLAGLASRVHGNGCAIHEHSEVSEITGDKTLTVVANGVSVVCDFVVIATHVPLMGKTGFLSATLLQTKLTPRSSYVVSGRVSVDREERVPELSMYDTSDPYYYLRTEADSEGDRFIFGGNDHKTGQEVDTDDCYRRLEGTLRGIFPRAMIDHHWSGQVIETSDGLPLIGETAERQFVATGFNGNGITFGTVAAMMARDAMLKWDNPWGDLFSVSRKTVLRGAWDYVRQNLDFPYYMVADRLRPAEVESPEDLERGAGAVLKIDGKRVACSRDNNGTLHQVSAICTHLGCVVRWNGAEQTWDCPCHGSRFKPTGAVIAGPAETPLEPVETPLEPVASTAKNG